MNILLYHVRGFNPTRGGIERISCSVAKSLKTQNHNVFFATFNDETTDFENENQIKKIILPNKKNIYSNENIEEFIFFINTHKIDVIISQTFFDKESIKLLSQIRDKIKIKLISIIHSTPNFLVKSLNGYREISRLPSRKNFKHLFIKTPIVFIARRVFQYYYNKKSERLFLQASQSSDALIVLSKNYIPLLYKMNKQIKLNNNIYAIPNINTYPEESLNLEKKENLILFVGRLSHEKHPEKAMWIWKNLQHQFPSWEFKLLGDGNKVIQNDLNFLKTKWNLQRFSLEGRQDPKEYYKKAKILFLLSDYEGFPMVLTEAMQYGVVPISFKSSEGISDIITNRVDGEIIDDFKLKNFIKKAEELMNNPEKLELEAKAAHLSSKRFSSEKISVQWEEMLQKIYSF